MLDAHIQAKIKEYVAGRLQTVQLKAVHLHEGDLAHFTSMLPLLSPLQIRTICKAQEQTIIQKIIALKPYDLYTEIAKVCPNQKDLQTISSEELASRLTLYTSKLTLNERIICESQSSEEEQSKSQCFFGDVADVGDMCFELRPIEDQNNNGDGLRNIMEDCEDQNWVVTSCFGLG